MTRKIGRIFLLLFIIGVIGNFIPTSADQVYAATDVHKKMIEVLYGGKGGVMTCDFDGYVNTSGRHEGIDFCASGGKDSPIYSLIDGEIINYSNSSSLSTLAIYDSTNNKTVIYLHGYYEVPADKKVSKGQYVGKESNLGTSSAHTHIEVRDGRKTSAAVSVGDNTLNNPNPYSYWEKIYKEMNWKNITSFGFDYPTAGQEIADEKFRFQGWAVCSKSIKSITCSLNDGQKYITANLYTREDVPGATAFLADIPTALLKVGNNKVAVCINYTDGTGEVADYRVVNRTRPTYFLGYDSPTDHQQIDSNSFVFQGWLTADKEIKEISCSLNDGKKYFVAKLYTREDVPKATAFRVEVDSSWLNYGENAVSVCVGYKDGTSETVGRRIVKKVIIDAIDSPKDNVTLKNDSDTLHLGGWSLHDNKKIDHFEYTIGNQKYTLGGYVREDLSENARAFTSQIPATRFKEAVNKLNIYVHYTDGSNRLIGTRTVNRHLHTYGNWSVTENATCTEKGSKKRTCTGCEAYETQEIDALGHNYVNSVCTVCGSKDPNSSQEIYDVFKDVSHGAWYASAVKYVYENGLMSGNNGLFNPSGNVTRAQLVTTLYNIQGKPAVTDFRACQELVDVEYGAWYTNAVCWAYNTGVASGNDTTKMFNMNSPVTRQQLATFFYNYAEYKNLDTKVSADISGMKNADQVASYAQKAIRWAVGTGIISGSETTDSTGNRVYDLKPTGTATRAQLSTILQRFCENNNI